MFHADQQIGPYILRSRLGKGGFGEVWLAERTSQFFTKKVAVKLPHEEQVNFDTVRREAELWEEASGHPNVLPIIDADVYDGQVVIVSEYADGGSLADMLQDVGTTSLQRAVELTMGILSGLEFLHNKRIIHRDIKPQNILIQGGTPRLADFGISRAMQTTAFSSAIIGTDAYMSPEAFDGKRSVQTDLWSVGVVLYQLLNGTLPFPQDHPSERMFAVLTKDFEPLADDIPATVTRIVEKALQKLPENRYASAAEMRDELSRALATTSQQPSETKTEVLQRPFVPTPALGKVPEQALDARTVGENAPASVVTQVASLMDSSPPGFVVPDIGSNATGVNSAHQDVSRRLDRLNGMQIIVGGVGGLLVLVFMGYLCSLAGDRKPAGSTLASPTPYYASNVLVNKPASSNSTYGSNMSNASNTVTYGTPDKFAVSPGATPSAAQLVEFCKDYREGWDAGWKQIKGKNFTSPVAPCPPDSEYGDRYIFDKGLDDGLAAAKKR